MNITCAIYCRLSREDAQKTTESESIQNQKSLLINFALQHGWDIFKIYSDDDYSGIDSSRPEFNIMLADAQAGRFNIVLCKSQARFTRDIELVEKYIHNKFVEWGIRFVTVADNVDTEIKGTKKARQINGLINEWYLEDLSENIKAVLDNKRKNGQYIGSFATYGYKKCDKNHNKLQIDENAAYIVKEIFNLYLNGAGKQAIANKLNELCIPNPAEYKRQCGFNYKNGSAKQCGTLWNKTTVGRILQNEIYTGTMVQGKKKKLSYKSKKLISTKPYEWFKCSNTHEAIIDDKTFGLVQVMLESRIKSSRDCESNILAGKVFCLNCGSTMCKVGNSYKGGEMYYLRCKNNCTAHSIRLDILTTLITDKIKEYIKKYFDFNNINKIINDSDKNTNPNKFNQEIKNIGLQILNRHEALKLVFMSLAENKIDNEQFDFLNNKINIEIKALQKRLAYLQKQLTDEAINNNLESYTLKLLEFNIITRELICLFIDNIKVGENNKKTAEQIVIINWLI